MNPFYDDFTERPVSRAEEQPCPCHGKTEAETAAPYALLAISLPVIAVMISFTLWLMS